MLGLVLAAGFVAAPARAEDKRREPQRCEERCDDESRRCREICKKYAGGDNDSCSKSCGEEERKCAHLVIANAGAWGLGRKTDELILAQADLTSSFVGSYAGGLSRSLLLQAVEELDNRDVPDDGQRWGLLTPRQWSIALTIPEFASADFVGDDLPYMQRNRTRAWLGVNWMRHTGLPGKGTANAVCFTYHRNALGHASGADVTSDITWHGDRAAHFVNNMMSQGSCLIDAEGVIEIRVDDTAGIPA
jgi:hypothetical protein